MWLNSEERPCKQDTASSGFEIIFRILIRINNSDLDPTIHKKTVNEDTGRFYDKFSLKKKFWVFKFMDGKNPNLLLQVFY